MIRDKSLCQFFLMTEMTGEDRGLWQNIDSRRWAAVVDAALWKLKTMVSWRTIYRRQSQISSTACRLLPLLGLCGLLLAIGAPSTQAAPVTRLSGKVMKVLDGDSFLMRAGQEVYEVRLWGVDSPEHGQAYGEQAKAAGRKLLQGKLIRVEVVGRDSYARYLGIVYSGGLPVNEEMIRQGAAWVYRRYCRQEICNSWLATESEARLQRRGLWAGENPLPPWKWRRK